MASRYKFFTGTSNKKIESWIREDLKDLLTSNKDVMYTIPKGEEYRPDIIANKFYGDSTLSWILTYVNNISNSPEGYYVDRIIRVPYYLKVLEVI